jgi:hypothetical protein
LKTWFPDPTREIGEWRKRENKSERTNTLTLSLLAASPSRASVLRWGSF